MLRRMQADGIVRHLELRADIHQQALHGADIAHARDAAQRTGSSVSSAAANAGSAEFLEPLVAISPLRCGSACDYELIHGCLSGSPPAHVSFRPAFRADAISRLRAAR